ncbi:MAG: NAD-dependent epimerase/dehydratase family protein [Pseudomonadota bacterium]|nr:NAD-dependent epimerase/dehydratase family protein [Pseudomonadota bacterium]
MNADSAPTPRARVLLLGASGFIGRHVHQALLAAGHTVRVAGRTAPQPAQRVDFARATQAAHWLPLLGEVDAVINTVGVLRDSARQPMQAIHADAPCALFTACVQAGVRRVLHLSALGIDGSDTPYARTKRVADAHLLALHQAGALRATVLRPSLVVGPGSASSRLFMALARLPWLALPQAALRTRVQPLAVGDLADAVAALLGPLPTSAQLPSQLPTLLPLGGPSALTLAQFIASLRAQAGHAPARVWPMPGGLTRASARLGDALPLTPWGRQTLALLSADNVTDPHTLGALIGRAPVPPQQLLAHAQAAMPRPAKALSKT